MGSRPPLKAKRDANEPEIFKTLRSHGLSVKSMDEPADALVGFGGRTYLVEVKMPKGTFTPPQERFQETWKGDYHVLRSVEDAEVFARWVRDLM
tara:strand:- start:2994 stop:3275 length:282 start_codon:yes stop_codon:yes gene_type:complete